MNNLQKRFINRFIARTYLITKNNSLRLFLLNFFSQSFVDNGNRIEYDLEKKLFWFKNGDQYLPPAVHPNFHFNVNRFKRSAEDYMCRRYTPQKGDTIIDLGAGIGEEVYFFLQKIKEQGILYSIEASPQNFKSLELLTKKYGFKNCLNFNIAISNIIGEITIEEDDFYLLKQVNKNADGVKIPCYTLDSFVQKNEIEKINFLKVNIEGSEYEMIDGMKESVKIIDNAAISCHDFLQLPGKENIKEKVTEFFEENGFKVYFNELGHYVQDSWIYAERKRISEKK